MPGLPDRERFCCILSSGPLLQADAIVVLTGDDDVREQAALQAYAQGGAPRIVVAGGLDNPPHSHAADYVRRRLIEHGLAPDRIITDDGPQNTHDQAKSIVAMAMERDWRRILLVVSPYHQYRAFLTFLQEMLTRGTQEDLHVIPMPASQAPWFEPMHEDEDTTRDDLLAEEFAKIERYRQKGHVAGWAEGLAYLEHWERAAREEARQPQ